mmetsp:Transcript_111861/g.167487  ORF Transcript_111861/g.167487 Transcript_111861/m.167487 type:complete len:83 (-) Transcript_111861:2549-2797(-)
MCGFSARMRRTDISADPALKSAGGTNLNSILPQLWGLSLGCSLNATVFVRRSYRSGNPNLDDDNSTPAVMAVLIYSRAFKPP